MERNCELCPARAALYCEADEAYVCWECDSKVHGANFLVARHYRAVLCRKCSFPTLWRASGARFHPTTCLCPPCQSQSIASTGSDKKSNVNQRNSAVRFSANSSIQNLKGQDITEKAMEYETTVCSSACQAKENIALSSISDLPNKRVSSSFDVDNAPEARPRSPVSVISRGRALSKKRRTLFPEHASFESSSDSDLDDSSDLIDSQETNDSSQILELAFKWTESPLFPKIARRRQSLIRIRNRKRQTLDPQLRTQHQPQLSRPAEARTERVVCHWHDRMNLRSPVTVALAMHLFRRFSCVIKVPGMDRLDARIILACCLWIAIKIHNPQGAESRSRLYEQCTGIPLQILLATESSIFRLMNWRIGQDGCKEDMPRWEMNDI